MAEIICTKCDLPMKLDLLKDELVCPNCKQRCSRWLYEKNNKSSKRVISTFTMFKKKRKLDGDWSEFSVSEDFASNLPGWHWTVILRCTIIKHPWWKRVWLWVENRRTK